MFLFCNTRMVVFGAKINDAPTRATISGRTGSSDYIYVAVCDPFSIPKNHHLEAIFQSRVEFRRKGTGHLPFIKVLGLLNI